MNIRPFRIEISDNQLNDLRSRLRASRWPTPVIGANWDDGTDLDLMKRLANYWRDHFNWKEQEERLNRLPHYMATINGAQVHFVHQQGYRIWVLLNWARRRVRKVSLRAAR